MQNIRVLTDYIKFRVTSIPKINTVSPQIRLLLQSVPRISLISSCRIRNPCRNLDWKPVRTGNPSRFDLLNNSIRAVSGLMERLPPPSDHRKGPGGYAKETIASPYLIVAVRKAGKRYQISIMGIEAKHKCCKPEKLDW